MVTPEIVRVVDAMDDPAAGDATRRAAFHAAAEKHVARAKGCQAGDAPEQYLWELQLIQRRRGAELGRYRNRWRSTTPRAGRSCATTT